MLKRKDGMRMAERTKVKVELDGAEAWLMAWEIVHRGFHLAPGEREIKVNGKSVLLKRSGEIVNLDDQEGKDALEGSESLASSIS